MAFVRFLTGFLLIPRVHIASAFVLKEKNNNHKIHGSPQREEADTVDFQDSSEV